MTLGNNQEKLPLLVSINPNNEDKRLLTQIAQEQNCQLSIIDNSLEALYKLNQSNQKPSLIFTPNEMSILTGGEFCRIIRRLALLQTIPIIIYTYQFHKTRKIENLPNYGATEILDYNQFTDNHLSSLVLKYSQQKNDPKATIQQSYDFITKS